MLDVVKRLWCFLRLVSQNGSNHFYDVTTVNFISVPESDILEQHLPPWITRWSRTHLHNLPSTGTLYPGTI